MCMMCKREGKNECKGGWGGGGGGELEKTDGVNEDADGLGSKVNR